MKQRPFGYNNWREFAMAFRRRSGAKAVARAIRRKELIHPRFLKCQDCGKPAACYDHRDYRKPLAVDPVCKKCDSKRGSGKPYCPMGSTAYEKLLAQAKAYYSLRIAASK